MPIKQENFVFEAYLEAYLLPSHGFPKPLMCPPALHYVEDV